MTAQQIFEKSLELYENGGQSAVLEWAATQLTCDWKYCDPCEYNSPVLGGLCLVCWSEIKN
jgi:hypothetical protein